MHDGIVFKGNRGDLRIGHQVARSAEAHEQSQHASDVVGRRFRNPHHQRLLDYPAGRVPRTFVGVATTKQRVHVAASGLDSQAVT